MAVTLKVDGRISPEYTNAVREFQFSYSLPQTGRTNSPTQDKIIRANHTDPMYVDWLQRALIKSGAGYGLTANGIMNNQTKKAIRSFQAYSGLGDDGWVGAKTETVILDVTGIDPPGQITDRPKRGGDVRKPKSKPPSKDKPPLRVSTSQIRTRLINNFRYSIIYDAPKRPKSATAERASLPPQQTQDAWSRRWVYRCDLEVDGPFSWHGCLLIFVPLRRRPPFVSEFWAAV